MKDFPHLFLGRQPAQGTIFAGSDHLVLKERRSHQLKVQLLHLKEFECIACLTKNFWTLSVQGSHKRQGAVLTSSSRASRSFNTSSVSITHIF